MTANEWLAKASKRDRLLVWQHDDPIDLPLPKDTQTRLEIRYACAAEFDRVHLSDDGTFDVDL